MSSWKCNVCDEQFDSRRNLQNHHLRAKHTDIALVCPWCEGRPKEFKWAQDLRRHARTQHKDLHDAMSAKFLSTNNCFYFCKTPSLYKDLFDVTLTETTEGYEAKQLMARWCTTHNQEYKKWQDGWKLATSTTQPQTSNIPARTQPTPHIHQSPLGKRTHENDYTIQHIAITPTDIKCYIKNEESFFLIRLKTDTFDDTKAITSLTRKMTTLPRNFQPPTDTWKLHHHNTHRKDLSVVLGVLPSHISTIFTQSSTPFKLVKTQANAPLIATEAEDTLQTTANSPASTPTHTTTSPKHFSPTLTEQTLRSPTPISLVGDESPSYNPDSPTYTATPLTHKSSTLPQPQTPKCITYSPQCTTKTLHSNTESTEKSTTATEQYSPKPINTNNPTYIPTPKLDTIQQEAQKLLSVGSHPLLPAARRDWSAVSEESVSLTESLKWPPKNWRSLTADQRTLASEYAAMTLHNSQHTSLQISDRTQLLHRYNFIVLPGCKGTTQTPLTNAQYYNYQLIRLIATGNSTLPREEQRDILAQFTKNKITSLQQTIAHIPLRLTK